MGALPSTVQGGDDPSLKFLQAQEAQLVRGGTPFAGANAAKVPAAKAPAQRARENLVQVLFNHNDFVTIR